MITITIEGPQYDLSARKIVSEGNSFCEHGHKVQKGKIAFQDGADVVLCTRHFFDEIKIALEL